MHLKLLEASISPSLQGTFVVPLSMPIFVTMVLGNHGGDIICTTEEQENKIPDSQKDVRRRAKIGAQKSAKHKTAYRDCVT